MGENARKHDLRLPWHRETIGHANIGEIADQVARDLAVPLSDGIPPNTDATWIVNADNKIVAFVGNGPRQTDNADAIIEAIELGAALNSEDVLSVLRFVAYDVTPRNDHEKGIGDTARALLADTEAERHG